MSEGAELTLANLGDSIRDKVRKTLMDSIPEAQMDVMIKKEFEGFFSEQHEYRYNGQIDYDKPKRPSIFSARVHAELEKQLQVKINEAVKKKLDEAEQRKTDVYGSQELVGSLVEAMVPMVMAGMAKALVQNTLQNLKQQFGSF